MLSGEIALDNNHYYYVEHNGHLVKMSVSGFRG